MVNRAAERDAPPGRPSAASHAATSVFLTSVIGAFGAAAIGAGTPGDAQGQERMNQENVKKTFMPAKEITTHLEQCRRADYRLREPAHAAIRKAEIDLDGLYALKAYGRDPDAEVANRAKQLFGDHKEPFIPAVWAAYKGKDVLPRNFPRGPCLWRRTFLSDFHPPPYFTDAHEMPYTLVFEQYLKKSREGGGVNKDPEYALDQRAAQELAQGWLQAAARHHVGERDADERMKKEFITIRSMFERWVVAENKWHMEMQKEPDRIIPIPKELPDKQSSLTPREKLSLTLNRHLEERRTVNVVGMLK